MTFTGEPSKIIDIPEPQPDWPHPEETPKPAPTPVEEPERPKVPA